MKNKILIVLACLLALFIGFLIFNKIRLTNNKVDEKQDNIIVEDDQNISTDEIISNDIIVDTKVLKVNNLKSIISKEVFYEAYFGEEEDDRFYIKDNKVVMKNISFDENDEIVFDEYVVSSIDNPSAIFGSVTSCETETAKVYVLTSNKELYVIRYHANKGYYDGIMISKVIISNIDSIAVIHDHLNNNSELDVESLIVKTTDNKYYSDYPFDIEDKICDFVYDPNYRFRLVKNK